MKVVLLHDWITGYRGGERVLSALCELFPDAPIYTLIYQHNSTNSNIENRKIYSSILNKIPGIQNYYRKLLPLFPLATKTLQIKEQACLILSSSHCVIKGVVKPKNSIHISYVHSPMRYLYDQYDNYFGPHTPIYQRMGAKIFRNYLTKWDQNSNQNVDYFVANSKFVQQRIDKYYKKTSTIIHPFVDTLDFKPLKNKIIHKKDYFIVLSAFAPNKKIDLAIKAFNKIKLPLKIIGSGQQENYLKSIANSNIEFLGSLNRKDVIKYLSEAQALIFPGVEDFGITPLESLASGTPVIALKTGGVLETLNNKVATFFSEPNEVSLIKAIEEFRNKTFEKNELIVQADQFSKEKFKSEIMSFIESKLH